MTEDHEDTAAAAERELADMEERSERVGEHIDEARKDWEAKQADPARARRHRRPGRGRRGAPAARSARDGLRLAATATPRRRV